MRTPLRFENTVALRLTLMAVVPMAVIVVLGAVVFRFQTRPYVLEEYQGDIDATLELHHFFITEWLDQQQRLLSFVSTAEAARTWDIETLGSTAPRLVESFDEFAAMVFVNSDGYVDLDTEGKPGGFVGDRTYFQKALSGASAISEVLVSRNTGVELVILANPIYGEDDVVRGVVFAPVYLETLNTLIEDLSTKRPIFSTLLDVNGEVIATNCPELSQEAGLIPEYKVGTTPTQLQEAPAGGLILLGRMEIPQTAWSLVVRAPLDDLIDTFSRYNRALSGTIVSVALILALIAFLASRSITLPMRVLDEMGRHIAKEDYAGALESEISKTSPVELQRLYSTILGMASLVETRQRELQRISLTDPLTSLANRRHLTNEGRRIITMCGYTGDPCSLLVFDIDKFKKVNDTYGHEVGDRVLVWLARTASRLLRAGDLLTRYGGEEFIAVLPRTDCREARMLAERVRSSIAEEAVPVPELDWSITISVGVSEVAVPGHPGNGHSSESAALEEAISEADYHLYKAKRAGRNRVSSPC